MSRCKTRQTEVFMYRITLVFKTLLYTCAENILLRRWKKEEHIMEKVLDGQKVLEHDESIFDYTLNSICCKLVGHLKAC